MVATIECVRADEWEEWVRNLDQEFILGKGRRGSLASRLPHVVNRALTSNVYVARSGSGWMASVAVRKFEWRTPARNWQGAMVGLVYTKPECRGRGAAAGLLREVATHLRTEGVEFGVLWTKIQDYYRRLGWVSADHGLFGQGTASRFARDAARAQPFEAGEIPYVEAIRERWCPCRVARTAACYAARPLPCDSLELVKAQAPGEAEGYALVGRAGDVGYVYEVHGAPAAYISIWEALCASYAKVLVNDHAGGVFSSWLSNSKAIVWGEQQQTMWYPLSKDATVDLLAQWHVGYFDRI
jgi:predicted N-acetyltransferase YhbS